MIIKPHGKKTVAKDDDKVQADVSSPIVNSFCDGLHLQTRAKMCLNLLDRKIPKLAPLAPRIYESYKDKTSNKPQSHDKLA